ncbi:L-histidine N(alpha)-methyltransferase [Sphingomonas turrisvirgatae]|uniref:Dimethylhistidine N-methyltransferase n=1 Tax=Sphingomonas turrisvirgatae TaxID=1888892 RepID=A0A1E3LWM4_9SPHN|nr:L-histidine N(alpha)-methyltransferase [Sphingomonas turrisvirgatae]ODP38191.1 dimethylhistidine N-methyltransferase [Sphingomonas turrisvirgatae]
MLKQEVEDGQHSLVDPQFRADVVSGLLARPRAIPARWFYDHRGSELFEDITQLPEYYPTRTETALLERVCPDVARAVDPGSAVVEFGSGSSLKTPLLLRCVRPTAYIPIDISGDFLRESAATIADEFPDISVEPLEGDFLKPLKLPADVSALAKLGFFPGSTIGNMTPAAAVDLLRAMRQSLGIGASLLIGIDRIKDPAVLLSAYDDAQGVTASFNLNLLTRINREIAGTIPLDAFRHVARWNDDLARIEMHLEATRDATFDVDGRTFDMAAGETIHTENSHKYGSRDARLLLAAGGWTVTREWTDDADWFALYLAQARDLPAAP